MRTIEVCLSPQLLQQYPLTDKLIVVADILRATSCIVTGLANGVTKIKVASEIDKVIALGKQGYVTAGERGGIKVPAFDIGNSPLEYLSSTLRGRKIAISTTNGSQAIIKARKAKQVIIGSFLNLNATAQHVLQNKHNLIILCAGWKGTVSLEDTLFAGALIDECAEEMIKQGDATTLAHQLYIANHNNLYNLLKQSAHAERLTGFGMEKDLAFCITLNQYDVIPTLEGEDIVATQS